MKKTFENCLWEELTKKFELEKLKNFQPLIDLLTIDLPTQPIISDDLLQLNSLLVDNFMDWNEDELKMQFISPLLYIVNYHDNPKYHPFSQRTLKMQTSEVELSGVVDWMLASGRQVPTNPFFFLHEYKKEKGTDNDPVGQLLASMLTAQYLNEDKEKTIYGAYIIGKDWYFMALAGKQYAISFPYNAMEMNKLEFIYAILKRVKELV